MSEDGAVVVEGLLEPQTLEALNAELDPHVEDAALERDFLNPGIAYFFGKNTRHVTAVASKSRTLSVVWRKIDRQ